MVLGAEPGRPRDLGGGGVHRFLEPRRGGDVFDHAAVRADEMMVVAGEVFCQLEAGVLVVGDDPVHEPRLLEHHQVAVHRALGEVMAFGQDLRDRERSRRGREHADDRFPVGGEPLVDLTQPARDRVAQVGRHPGHSSVG